MVNIMEHPIKMDDLGGPPLFLETPICSLRCKYHLTSFSDLLHQSTQFFQLFFLRHSVGEGIVKLVNENFLIFDLFPGSQPLFSKMAVPFG